MIRCDHSSMPVSERVCVIVNSRGGPDRRANNFAMPAMNSLRRVDAAIALVTLSSGVEAIQLCLPALRSGGPDLVAMGSRQECAEVSWPREFPSRSRQACGCGSRPGSGSGRGRVLPAGGTADVRGVAGSSTDSRFGFLPLSRSVISSPVKVSNSSKPLASVSRSARFYFRDLFRRPGRPSDRA